jgi:hypothetical protein
MIFDEAERSILADVLIPASAGFLSASQAGVAAEGLDQVLAVRPDLEPGLRQKLQSAKGRDPADVVRELQTKDAAGFAELAEVVAGAYFLNRGVRAGIGYHGQVPRARESASDYLDEGLLQAVIDRGPIYRPTPMAKRHL